METTTKLEAEPAPQPKLKIYFLPNLMTAGNLFCGFVALTKIVEAAPGDYHPVKVALGFIFLACVFDSLDGRLARMGGVESPFGREFDSLADLISFGAAPAFLVHKIVLHPIFADPHINQPEIGWFIASIYLICGALRLARFNCLATMPGAGGGGKEFMGFPIPAAAGLVASVTFFLMWNEARESDFLTGWGRFVLPALMLFLSVMMVSEVKYPSFKKLDMKARRTFPKMVIAILIIGGLVVLWRYILPIVLPIVFTAYLLYGFIRPRISRKVREEIEDEPEDDEPSFTA
ncbi:MAG: CDP-alcohol phosphatidyltransferase [Verrucomicrobiales bacterium]|nr:CDP-alcohol phosphatidyltransferase [Verrucomicrobiales bacterium]